MKNPLVVENTITINAPAIKVWEVLTRPEQTKKYMFGCETVSDWKKGSTLDWVAPYEGQPVTFVTGIICEIEPHKLLAYTTIDAQAAERDAPDKSIVATYELTESQGQTTLKVSQGDFSNVVNGDKRYAEVYNNGDGWNPILVQIKAIAEQNP
jgi:uncharacterized protein YndB with AHSA1/START domain